MTTIHQLQLHLQHVTEKLLLGPSSEPNMCRIDDNDVKAAVFNFIRTSGCKL